MKSKPQETAEMRHDEQQCRETLWDELKLFAKEQASVFFIFTAWSFALTLGIDLSTEHSDIFKKAYDEGIAITSMQILLITALMACAIIKVTMGAIERDESTVSYFIAYHLVVVPVRFGCSMIMTTYAAFLGFLIAAVILGNVEFIPLFFGSLIWPFLALFLHSLKGQWLFKGTDFDFSCIGNRVMGLAMGASSVVLFLNMFK